MDMQSNSLEICAEEFRSHLDVQTLVADLNAKATTIQRAWRDFSAHLSDQDCLDFSKEETSASCPEGQCELCSSCADETTRYEFPGNVYEETEEEIIENRLKRKQMYQYRKAFTAVDKKIEEEINKTLLCSCHMGPSHVPWTWENGRRDGACDWGEYGDLCLWAKGKKVLREIYSVDEDKWYESNPRVRGSFGEHECEEKYFNLTLPSRLEITKNSESYIGMIFVIDWEFLSRENEEMIQISYNVHCDDSILIYDDMKDFGVRHVGRHNEVLRCGGELFIYDNIIHREKHNKDREIKDKIRDMLTIVDENSDKIPEGIILQLMNQCKELYDI